MHGLKDRNTQKLARKLKRARRKTWAVLTLENVSAQGWRVFTWVLVFAGAWLFEAPAEFGQIGEIVALAVFVAGVVYFTIKDVRFLKLPSAYDIDRRIEERNELTHRPLQAIDDALANPQKMNSRILWSANRQRSKKLLNFLRIPAPRPLLVGRDPYALRLAAVLFCGLGLAAAGHDWQQRIVRGLTPFNVANNTKARNGLRLVITPPEYTGLKPLILEASNDKVLQIPDGSMLKATVHGMFGKPVMKIDDTQLAFETAGKHDYILEFTAPQGSELSIVQSYVPRAHWNYKIVPDTPPEITMRSEMQVMYEGTMNVPLKLKDDYGVKILSMHMDLGRDVPEPPLGKPVTMTRSVLSSAGAETEITPSYDLTAHPWAGLPVTITFTAEDHLAQKSGRVSIDMKLPERHFSDPLAKTLVSLRRRLLKEPMEDYHEIQEALEEIQMRPDLFRRDNIVLLTLRAAASRLYWSGPSIETASAVTQLLWDTALRIEDGNFSIAARNLRTAQNELEEALRNPETSKAEIARLMQNMRSAMDEYFMELQREIQKSIAEGKPLPFVPSEMMSNLIDPEMMAGILQQMESQIMAGDRDAAQQMLSQLQNMMDAGTPKMAELPKDVQQLIENSKAMQALIDRQQALFDETQALGPKALDPLQNITRDFGIILPEDKKQLNQWGLESMPPSPQMPEQTNPDYSVDTSANYQEQETLRYELGEIMARVGEILESIPENFGKAELEMRGSSKALNENQPGFSLPHQKEALKHLRESRQNMNQELAQRLKNMSGFAFGGSGMRYDPLGRPYGEDGNGDPDSSVKIPDEQERKRAQEILRLLQKRSGEFQRPEDELEYYHRLLRQF